MLLKTKMSLDDLLHDEIVFQGGFSLDEFMKSFDEDDECISEIKIKVIKACDELHTFLLLTPYLSTAGMIVEHDGRLYNIILKITQSHYKTLS